MSREIFMSAMRSFSWKTLQDEDAITKAHDAVFDYATHLEAELEILTQDRNGVKSINEVLRQRLEQAERRGYEQAVNDAVVLLDEKGAQQAASAVQMLRYKRAKEKDE